MRRKTREAWNFAFQLVNQLAPLVSTAYGMYEQGQQRAANQSAFQDWQSGLPQVPVQRTDPRRGAYGMLQYDPQTMPGVDAMPTAMNPARPTVTNDDLVTLFASLPYPDAPGAQQYMRGAQLQADATESRRRAESGLARDIRERREKESAAAKAERKETADIKRAQLELALKGGMRFNPNVVQGNPQATMDAFGSIASTGDFPATVPVDTPVIGPPEQGQSVATRTDQLPFLIPDANPSKVLGSWQDPVTGRLYATEQDKETGEIRVVPAVYPEGNMPRLGRIGAKNVVGGRGGLKPDQAEALLRDIDTAIANPSVAVDAYGNRTVTIKVPNNPLTRRAGMTFKSIDQARAYRDQLAAQIAARPRSGAQSSQPTDTAGY